MQLGNVAGAPVVYSSEARFSSSLQTVIIYGEALLNTSDPRGTSNVSAELLVGKKERPVSANVRHVEENVAMLAFSGVRLTNRDTGPVKCRWSDGSRWSEWTQVGVVDIGRLPLQSGHSMLRSTGGEVPFAAPTRRHLSCIPATAMCRRD